MLRQSFVTACSLAVLASAKNGNAKNSNGVIGHLYDEISDLEGSLTTSIGDLQDQINTINNRLDTIDTTLGTIDTTLTGLRTDVDTVTSDLDDLENRSVIEDHFYNNRIFFDVEEGQSCYDVFTITGGNVLDFAANFTLRKVNNVRGGEFRVELFKGSQVVARGFDDRGLPAGTTGTDFNH